MNYLNLLAVFTVIISSFTPTAFASDCYMFTGEGPNRIGGVKFANEAKTLCIGMYVANQYSLLFTSASYAQLAEANCKRTERPDFTPGGTDQEAYATVDGKSSVEFDLKYDAKLQHFTGSISVDGKSYPAVDVH